MQQPRYPKYSDIQGPLISELYRRGGESRPSAQNRLGQSVYDALADIFGLSDAARNYKIYEDTGAARSKWHNIVRWVRNDLKKAGLLHTPAHGVWALTDAGILAAKEIDKESAIVGEGGSFSEIDIESLLTLRTDAMKIGESGEEYALEYEKQRLQDLGKPDLACLVERISLTNAGAGYDIRSFEKGGESRLIEVKTTTGEGSQFQLTHNEYRVAQLERARYWIYFVRLLDGSDPEVRQINDPIGKQAAGELLLRCSSFWVTILDDA